LPLLLHAPSHLHESCVLRCSGVQTVRLARDQVRVVVAPVVQLVAVGWARALRLIVGNFSGAASKGHASSKGLFRDLKRPRLSKGRTA
jgi:hypothetical protein